MFSILMPVVKTAYFRQAFSSAVVQDYKNYEIIVLDNDADADIAWVNDFGRVVFQKNPNQLPIVENWNKALSLATGEYVLLLSDDDYLSDDCLSICAAEISEKNVPIARLGRVEVDAQGDVLSYSCPGAMIERFDEFAYNMLKYERGMCLADVVYRREALVSIGGFPSVDLAWGADQLAVYRMVYKFGYIFHVNQRVVFYRMHPANISSSLTTDSVNRRFAADVYWRSCLIELLNSNTDSLYLIKARRLAARSVELCYVYYLVVLARELRFMTCVNSVLFNLNKTNFSARVRLICFMESLFRSSLLILSKITK